MRSPRLHVLSFLLVSKICLARHCPEQLIGNVAFASQGDQDQYVYNKFFRDVCYGTFVELGMLDGFQFSNSLFFEKNRQWRGICIEASPLMFQSLTMNRPLCKNVNAVISDRSDTFHFWDISGYAAGLSGVSEFFDEAHIERAEKEIKATSGSKRVIEVQGTTIQSVLVEAGIDRVDFISLDTEGSELAILKTFDFSAIHVYVWCIEDNNGNAAEIKQLMSENGYSLDRHDQDMIFVKQEYRASVPSLSFHKKWSTRFDLPPSIHSVIVNIGNDAKLSAPPEDTGVAVIAVEPVLKKASQIPAHDRIFIVSAAIRDFSGFVTLNRPLQIVPVLPMRKFLSSIPENVTILSLETDMQGFDYVALKSARASLLHIRRIQSKVSCGVTYKINRNDYHRDFQPLMQSVGLAAVVDPCMNNFSGEADAVWERT
jgi:FkbM family methyltransferase